LELARCPSTGAIPLDQGVAADLLHLERGPMPTRSRSSIATDLLPNPHPGEILLEEFLKPMGLSQTALARAVKVPPAAYQRDRAGQARRHAEPDLRLARYFGMSEGFFPRPAGLLRADGPLPPDRRSAEGDPPARGVAAWVGLG